MTMKRDPLIQDEESQEKTIRPNWKPLKVEKAAESKSPHPAKPPSPRKRSTGKHQRQVSQVKNPLNNKFELPSRPDVVYREQSVEDYSDLFDDNDNVFNQQLNLVKKVRL